MIKTFLKNISLNVKNFSYVKIRCLFEKSVSINKNTLFNRDGFLGPIRVLDENDCEKLIKDYQSLIVRISKYGYIKKNLF